MRMNLQLFGGRGASSGRAKNTVGGKRNTFNQTIQIGF